MEYEEKKNCAKLICSLRCKNPGEHMKKNFLISTAPVLKGVKPSALVLFSESCRDAWHHVASRVCPAAGLEVKELYQCGDTFSVLIYNRRLLGERLEDDEAVLVLERFGYPKSTSIDDLLEHLKGRFADDVFPHEIGVFLGYPPRDVAGFIDKEGRDYLCCRYWKVYHNERTAREVFALIDRAIEQAALLIKRQVTLYEAVELLAAKGEM